MSRPDIVGWTKNSDQTYWLVHPDVVDAEVVSDPANGDTGYEHRLWLKPAREIGDYDLPGEEPGRIMPVRPPDIELFVEGAPHPTFVSRLPALEYLEHFVEAVPDEHYPHGWWVARIWISEPEYRKHSAEPAA
jgi:hypothetical protein